MALSNILTENNYEIFCGSLTNSLLSETTANLNIDNSFCTTLSGFATTFAGSINSKVMLTLSFISSIDASVFTSTQLCGVIKEGTNIGNAVFQYEDRNIKYESGAITSIIMNQNVTALPPLTTVTGGLATIINTPGNFITLNCFDTVTADVVDWSWEIKILAVI